MDVRTESRSVSGPGIHGLKVGRFSIQDFDMDDIEPVRVDRLDLSRVDILETFLVTKSMPALADILKPFRIMLWSSRGIDKNNKIAWAKIRDIPNYPLIPIFRFLAAQKAR